ncbi:TPA: hypothetical protein ACOEBG_000847 [Stenotrophomonas maltophilia]
MTEESDQQQDQQPASTEKTSGRQLDYMLQDLVQLANMGFGFGVTLCIGGSLVSGTVVSGRKYVQSILDKTIGEGVKEGPLRDALTKRFSGYLDLYPESNTPIDESTPLPVFIHLSGAKFYSPGNSLSTPADGVIWRGLISDVSGFNFGTLS